MKRNRYTVPALIFLGALIVFVPFLGSAHLFDWDEVNFAEAAREMLLTKDFSYVQIGFRPFWEKPPLFIWLQSLSMWAFGINEFAARLPNAICGAFTLSLLYSIGRRLVSSTFGFLWVLVYAGSMLPQFYFRSGIIDPWFNLLIFAGIHQLIIYTQHGRQIKWRVLASSLLIGLAVLTKGPTAAGIVIICLTVYILSDLKHHNWHLVDWPILLSLMVLIGLSFPISLMLRGQGLVVQEFIDYHLRLLTESEAGHGQPFYYHPIVLLIGCFPMSLFFLFGMRSRSGPPENIRHYRKWMTILFWVVLIVFSIVRTKIIHYSSLAYFPLSFLASWAILELKQGKWKFKAAHASIMMLFTLIFGTAFTLSGCMNSIRPMLLNLLSQDQFAMASLNQYVPDGIFDWAIGILFLLGASVSVVRLYKNRISSGIVCLFGTTLITVWLLTLFITPKIDHYFQSELFQFYEEKGDSAYLEPIGFHSYAHLFYGHRLPIEPQPDDELAWMLGPDVDRPVYFISRVQDVHKTIGYFPFLKEIDRLGGYVVLERTDDRYPFSELR